MSSVQTIPPSGVQSQTVKTPVVAVGASAGGLEALKVFLQHMPVNSGAAFVIIVHLDPQRKDLMVSLLSNFTSMPVVQAAQALPIIANHIYVIPSNRDLSISHGQLKLQPQANNPHGLHLPVDIFFNALAESQPDRAAAIILSGTGSDGTIGIRAIRQAGGMTIVQSPDEAQFNGMPNSAIATGLVDHVLPVADMGETLLSYARKVWFQEPDPTDASLESYNRILHIIQNQLGYNFHPYKHSTLQRRINRRISLKQLDDMDAYAALLRQNPDETIELFKDMLIGVTSFFRDPDSWALLESTLFDTLDFTQKIRIWVPGCSTGEEAYSMAMMLHEHMGRHQMSFEYQIFATDIDSRALTFARQGLYPKQIAANISAERLEMFFSEQGAYYKVLPWLRQNITFSEQNVTCDPPYSKLDLISCRNLFIYLQADSQKKVLEIFHFALKPHGFLMLGSSESAGNPSDLFEVISKKWRLYRKINIPRAPRFNLSTGPVRYGSINMQKDNRSTGIPAMRITDIARTALLQEYVPASVLVNSKYEVLYHFGETSDFLHYPTGETTNDLFALLRDGLATRVRGALRKAMKENTGVKIEGAKLKLGGDSIAINFRVKPLSDIKGGENLLLISFENRRPDQTAIKTKSDVPMDDMPLLKQLEGELSSTREELQNTIEELLTSNEELKAAHEEAMSSNEELQSSNEELETSKEELQSFNEELNTVNSELQEKVISLETANNDISNLINSTRNASIFLDTDLNIKFFTPSSKQLFNLIDSDIGRPLADIVARFDDPQLADDIQSVQQTEQPSHKEVQDSSGNWYNRRILPYRIAEDRILGTVITFDDITAIKHALDELRISEHTLREAQHTAHIGSWTNDFEGQISWSDELYHIYGISPESFTPTTETIIELVHPDDRSLLLQWNEECQANQHPEPIILRYIRPDGALRYIQRQGELVCDAKGSPCHISGTAQDISEQKQLEEQFLQAQKMEALGTLVGGIAHDFNNILAGITGNIYLARRHNSLPSDATERIETVESLSFRAAELIKQMLTFARKDKVSMQALPFSSFLKETLKFLRSSTPENIAIRQKITDKPMTITADATQIHQILMNLINNACDAVENVDEPCISIVLESVQTDSSFKQMHRKAGDHTAYAHLSVTDNGCGIPEHDINHLFDPFFTTKGQGKGTGLGLAMVFGAIQTHKGFIDVESTVGKGSTFHIYLPIKKINATADELVQDDTPAPGHGETILLVDDEKYIIETGKQVLESLGYRVLEARNGEDAVEVFHANKGEIALVIMDVVMPKMDGVTAAGKIQNMDPDMKFLFCSGYDKGEALPRDTASSNSAYLPKPYTVGDLSKLIRKLLES